MDTFGNKSIAIHFSLFSFEVCATIVFGIICDALYETVLILIDGRFFHLMCTIHKKGIILKVCAQVCDF